MSENDSTVSDGIANLQQIKQGNDPRDNSGRLRRVREEVNRLFIEHEMPESLDRSVINCYVADWQRKLGNCKYDTRIEPDEYGKRVTGIEREVGWYSIGVAKRTFDSDDTWKDTIRHELAHVTAYVKNGYESDGHGSVWQAEAERLGADPTRTDRVAPENRVEANYYLGCPNHCFRNGKQVRSKRVKHPSRYRCPKCEARCVSWAHSDQRPSEPGTCAVEW